MEDATAEFINATPAPPAGATAAPPAEAMPAHQLLVSNVAPLMARLRAEYRPRSLTEELYIREVARHGAALETVERAEPALLRTAASAVGPLAGNVSDIALDDLLLSTAITTEPLDRVARYRRGHERGLHLAIDKLRAYQAATYHNGATGEIPPHNFAREQDCLEYLRGRLTVNPPACPKCHGYRWHWLATRKNFECAGCKTQISLRHDTVFEHSALPLQIWFRAIRLFAANPAITIRQIRKSIGLRRRATARTMLAKIRAAHQAGNLACGLAGLLSYPLTDAAA